MSVFGVLMRRAMLSRCSRIERAVRRAVEEQYSTLNRLIERGRNTAFGCDVGLGRVHNAEQFARIVRRFDYASFTPYIERMRGGEQNVATQGWVDMFARSSGTSARSKYIPITRRALYGNHLRGMADAVALYLRANPLSQLFDGRTLTMAGHCQREGRALVGDLSALLVVATGRWGDVVRAPSRGAALVEDFDSKCAAIYEECAAEDIRALAGVPSWNMALVRHLLERTEKEQLSEVWPNIELFMHGGVSFHPYRAAFENAVGRKINYWESYNASEGFIAVAEECNSDEMLLMPHYGCYYEFARGDNVVPLEGVRCGAEYAVLISSENGLWRYELGDMVKFTSVDPYKIKIVGRTKQYINAFGEELMIGNVEQALLYTCSATGAVVEEFTVSAQFLPSMGGYHRWVVEFVRWPDSVERFAEVLDSKLRSLNSDYDAKRKSVMQPLQVVVVPRGTFHIWQMKERRRKVPRLKGDSAVSDALIAMSRVEPR